jgi:WD40 repeat protein
MALMKFAGAAAEGVGAIRFTPGGGHLVTTGYLPFVDADGLWQQKGVIRFWRVADGTLRQMYDARTSLGVTSPVAWSPDATRFAFGTYDGTAVVARTPAAMQADRAALETGKGEPSLEILANGDVRLRLSGEPGASYSVDASTDLLNWRAVGVATANANGDCQFLDTNSQRFSFRFYRTRGSP